MKLLTNISEIGNHPCVGGKASNLVKLAEIGMNVPKWVVIIDDFSDKIVDLRLLESFFGKNYRNMTFAVRSSGLDEDGLTHSFAGQFDTFLHVPFQELEEKIQLCQDSAFSERVISYRKENGLPESRGIGVIIQEMIDSEVSGVGFGINPATGVPNSKVINSVFGLGEGLVSGELNADSFELQGEKITKSLSNKSHQFIQNKHKNGIEKTELEKSLSYKSTLTETQIKEIAHVLDTLQEKLGAPQDIEFAYHNGQLFLLQTRPITAIANQDKGEYIIWDNSNIIESYPGITTPLTYSFITKMYEMVYRQFVGILSVSKKQIEANSEVFEHTLGLVRGRVYYNLLSWYKMLAMVPGYSINAENMERMMGVKEKFILQKDFTMSKSKAKWRTGIMVFKMLGLHLNLGRERKKFHRYLNGVISDYQSIDFDKLSADELIERYIQFETNLLLKWKAPLTNDFFAMIWFGMLEKQAIKYFPNQPNIHNDLLCGSQDIISVQPIHETIKICEAIKRNKEVEKLFLDADKKEIWAELEVGKHPEIKVLIDQYIIDFGNRCVGELKLESISYSQEPALFIGVIKSYLLKGVSASNVNSNLETEIREKASLKVKEAFQNKWLKRKWFLFCLKQTRSLVSNRENLRFERTRGFGMVRTMMVSLGKTWAKEGCLEHPRDIFYIELEEIKLQYKQPFDGQLKTLISERKKEFNAYKNQEKPMERFYTFGNNFDDEFIYSKEKLERAEKDLKGIGCCPGKITGKVRVVENPHDIESLNGDVLVTSSTDPGWVSLFPTASAILVERGSLLSHSAIVSREMGIPCIVGITGLLRTLKTGDNIEMNGSNGTIKIIEPHGK